MQGNNPLRRLIQAPFRALNEQIVALSRQLDARELMELAIRMPSFDTYEARLKRANDFEALLSESAKIEIELAQIFQILREKLTEQQNQFNEIDNEHERLLERIFNVSGKMESTDEKLRSQLVDELQKILDRINEAIKIFDKKIETLTKQIQEHNDKKDSLVNQYKDKFKKIKSKISIARQLYIDSIKNDETRDKNKSHDSNKFSILSDIANHFEDFEKILSSNDDFYMKEIKITRKLKEYIDHPELRDHISTDGYNELSSDCHEMAQLECEINYHRSALNEKDQELKFNIKIRDQFDKFANDAGKAINFIMNPAGQSIAKLQEFAASASKSFSQAHTTANLNKITKSEVRSNHEQNNEDMIEHRTARPK